MIVAPGAADCAPLIHGQVVVTTLRAFGCLLLIVYGLVIVRWAHRNLAERSTASASGVAGQPHRPAPPAASSAVAPTPVGDGSRPWRPPL